MNPAKMKQLHPRAFWLFVFAPIRYLVYLALLVILIRSILLEESPGYKLSVSTIIALAPFLVILAIIWAYLYRRLYQYELREEGFRKEYGVITKRYVTIPYERIQNVDIYRGVLHRMLGLSTLQIHTAGVGGSPIGEGRLPGLSREEAERLRDELIQRARQSKGQGL